ncbi:hypothetical protein J2S43_003935 [Catenuloplanes nepalensis]|uniref:Uncharacterized protein n=1 Tax=Catenuloplanes nepalensis TaxID=587533 RepID=A0ABT9MW17_9ACTN|nr:hypothetical protein [Catenuloplanes nepalensis]MDP9795423.1 hypothetical protein [Catenuloplanes nepalensis]
MTTPPTPFPSVSEPGVVSASTPAGLAVAAILSGAVLAAILTACVTVWIARARSREEERSHQRDLFAQAYAAYAAYREMPYAIRRRRHDRPAEERIRLSEALREIQERLSYYEAWTKAESPRVGDAYDDLVRHLRMIAGGHMRRAWQEKPIQRDRQMNIPTTLVDLSELKPKEAAYLAAVRHHLRVLAPWWRRRINS